MQFETLFSSQGISSLLFEFQQQNIADTRYINIADGSLWSSWVRIVVVVWALMLQQWIHVLISTVYCMYTTHSDAEYKTHMLHPCRIRFTPDMIQTFRLLTCPSGPLVPMNYQGRVQGWDDPRWWTSFRDSALCQGCVSQFLRARWARHRCRPH